MYSDHFLSSLDQLQRIFDNISEGFAVRGNWEVFQKIQSSLDHLFYSLCDEHPGSVAVRQSFDAYQNCVELGLRACYKELGLKQDLDSYFSTRMEALTQITDSGSVLQNNNESEMASEAVFQATISQAHDNRMADNLFTHQAPFIGKLGLKEFHPMANSAHSSVDSVTVIEIALKPRPSLVQNFIGREDILRSMHCTHITNRIPNLGTPAITVLSGLGGSGKTQTALKFALEFEEM